MLEFIKRTLKLNNMKKNNLTVQSMYNFLIGEKKVLSILEIPVSIGNLKTKSPIQMDAHNLDQPDTILILAEHIVRQIGNKEIDAIVGSKSTNLAFMVALKLNVPIFLISEDGKMKNLQGKKVAFVTDLIITGKNTSNSLSIIERCCGTCEEVYSVFDYNMNLKVNLKKVNINSLLDFSDIESVFDNSPDNKRVLGPVMIWKENEQYLFGKSGRKEVLEAVV